MGAIAPAADIPHQFGVFQAGRSIAYGARAGIGHIDQLQHGEQGGVFVRDLDAEMDEEYTKEIERLMDDCVAACRDLGLSLDDIEKCMSKKIKQIKVAERQADASEAPLPEGSGRIVTIDVGVKRAKREGER